MATIEPTENGPLLVKELDTLTDTDGEALPTRRTIALCRCGRSGRKPFCDGTHATVGFEAPGSSGPPPDGKNAAPNPTIRVTRDGPYEVDGAQILGRPAHENPCWLCRCGWSRNKPFCDGSHKNVHFRDG